MSDVVGEIKTLQGIVQSLIQSNKNMENSLERLRSVEQLLERVAGSNEEMLRLMHETTATYNQAIKRV